MQPRPRHPDPDRGPPRDSLGRDRVTRHDDSVWLCTTSYDQLHHGHVLQLTDGRWLGPDGWTVPPAPPPLWPEAPPF